MAYKRPVITVRHLGRMRSLMPALASDDHELELRVMDNSYGAGLTLQQELVTACKADASGTTLGRRTADASMSRPLLSRDERSTMVDDPPSSSSTTIESRGADTLLLLEHDPPVYTIGRQNTEEDFLVPIESLRQRGCDIVKTGRGGAVTWHGPGQIVGYPILNLNHYRPSVRWYIHALEEVLVRTLSRFGLRSHTTSDVGVWIQGERKIAAIGVSVSRWVTMHGFALNVCPDLTYYDAIIPCRIRDKEVTSLSKELKREVTVEEVVPVLLESFRDVFGNEWRREDGQLGR